MYGHHLLALPNTSPLLVVCVVCGLTLEWGDGAGGKGWTIISPDLPDCVPEDDDDRTDDYGFTQKT